MDLRRWLRLRRQLPVVAKLVVAACTTIASGYLALVGAGVIRNHARGDMAAIALIGAVSLAASLRAAYQEASTPARARRLGAVRQALEAAWLSAHQKAGIDMAELLVSSFAVVGRKRRVHLQRELRVGVMQIAKSTVRWEPGKGVVGECWANEAIARRDLTWLTDQYGDCSEADWNALDDHHKMGMSYKDWLKTRRKYDMVIAVAITTDTDRFIGCVALTGPRNPPGWLWLPEIEQALVAAADTIANAG